jgi:hypothetical protein
MIRMTKCQQGQISISSVFEYNLPPICVSKTLKILNQLSTLNEYDRDRSQHVYVSVCLILVNKISVPTASLGSTVLFVWCSCWASRNIFEISLRMFVLSYILVTNARCLFLILYPEIYFVWLLCWTLLAPHSNVVQQHWKMWTSLSSAKQGIKKIKFKLGKTPVSIIFHNF